MFVGAYRHNGKLFPLTPFNINTLDAKTKIRNIWKPIDNQEWEMQTWPQIRERYITNYTATPCPAAFSKGWCAVVRVFGDAIFSCPARCLAHPTFKRLDWSALGLGWSA